MSNRAYEWLLKGLNRVSDSQLLFKQRDEVFNLGKWSAFNKLFKSIHILDFSWTTCIDFVLFKLTSSVLKKNPVIQSLDILKVLHVYDL